MKIAAIVPEAKRIIVNFRALADNKTALRAIARESGRNAQVRKAKEFAEKAQELRLLTKAKPPAAAKDKSKDRAVKKSPPLQPHSGGLPEASAEGDGADDEPASLQVPKETTLDDLDDFWKRGGPKLWSQSASPAIAT
jgi:hypothetical protein